MRPPPPPGDDVCAVPAPVDDADAPVDRFCDLVLTGGIASGVVYPWAIVELARAYRFRNIGGTSVGAMAAALAAAAEFGRRTGADAPFETLRRLPAALGEDMGDGRTRMLSLFQSNPRGRRLVELWGALLNGSPAADGAVPQPRCLAGCGALLTTVLRLFRRLTGRTPVPPRKPATGSARFVCRATCHTLRIYRSSWLRGALGGALLGVLAGSVLVGLQAGAQEIGLTSSGRVLLVARLEVATVAALGALLGAPVALALALWGDFRHGVVRNNMGLCAGGTVEKGRPGDPRPALCEWLHEGIQRSAGLSVNDRPLTFRDLWNAPVCPGAAHGSCGADDPASQRSINLQMITSNVTHGRPFHMPFADETSRLFFKPADLEAYLPTPVLAALVAAAVPYARRGDADPPVSKVDGCFLQLPGADMPIVLAARLSLSFPLLFSAVPLYAIDYEAPRGERGLRRCLFSDGGISSNFPIHFFDAAMPRWPTFGLWLDRANPYHADEDSNGATRGFTPAQEAWREKSGAVWLPDFHREGLADSWDRFDPCAADAAEGDLHREARDIPVTGFLLALLATAKDWRDRTAFRLPHVRNRVARLRLHPGEGGLHIGMPRTLILQMAARYGTRAGKLFVERYADVAGQLRPAWREQRWVRLQLLIGGMRELLDGLSTGAAYRAHGQPATEAIADATRVCPLREGGAQLLEPDQKKSFDDLLAELEQLERSLRAAPPQPYRPVPRPELRLRAKL